MVEMQTALFLTMFCFTLHLSLKHECSVERRQVLRSLRKQGSSLRAEMWRLLLFRMLEKASIYRRTWTTSLLLELSSDN